MASRLSVRSLDPSGPRVDDVSQDGDTIVITAHGDAEAVACPARVPCHAVSGPPCSSISGRAKLDRLEARMLGGA